MLKIILEGDVKEEDSFNICLPVTTWCEVIPPSVWEYALPFYERKEKGKHEYSFRMRAKKDGKYRIPDSMIQVENYNQFFVTGSSNEISIEKNDADPKTITMVYLLPEIIRAGHPFVVHYKVEGLYKEINPLGYAPGLPGKITLEEAPEVRMLNTYMYNADQEENLYTDKDTIIYTYEVRQALKATRKGKYVLPPFRIAIDGQEYRTEAIPVEVIP